MAHSDVEIAQMYHAFNLGHQAVAGDDMPAPPWHSLPRSSREVAIRAVGRIRHGAVTTPAEHHEHWYDTMRARGYTWGAEKDHERKTHPALLHWGELPELYRTKARMFVVIVQGLLEVP